MGPNRGPSLGGAGVERRPRPNEEGTIRLRRGPRPRTPLLLALILLLLLLLLLGAVAGCAPSPAAALPTAVVTTSSDADGGSAAGRAEAQVGDGSVDTAWSTTGGPGAWVQLTWSTPQPLGTVVLRDRPTAGDGITGGTLTFDDGSAVQVGAPPDDGSPLAVHLTPRASRTVRFTVTGVAAGATSVGLAELAVRPTATALTRTTPAAAAPPGVSCPDGNVLDVVAHPDDDLFFLSPHVPRRLDDGACLRTVVLTSGDDGLDVAYWRSREEGLRAAYATITGAANAWTTTRVDVDGYFVDVDVLAADPRVSLVLLRLPEGNLLGQGFPATGQVSLGKLWAGQVGALTSLDGTLTVSSDQLVRLLQRLITLTAPTEINTLDPRPGRIDHDDHQFTARYVRLAAAGLEKQPQPTSYEGYTIASQPVNVEGADLGAKQAAFYAYAPYDKNICQSPAACAGTPDGAWLEREYVVPAG